MKQHITLVQWDGLSWEAKNHLWGAGFQKDWKMNIGQMIEFLGNDLDRIIFEPYEVFVYSKKWGKVDGTCELCDALWEAVKHKIQEGGMNGFTDTPMN